MFKKFYLEVDMKLHDLKKGIAFVTILFSTLCICTTAHATEDTVNTPITEEPNMQEEQTHQSLTLEAQVLAPQPVYYVDVPSDIHFGTIQTTSDTIQTYQIAVEVNEQTFASSATVTVTSDNTFMLENEQLSQSLPCHNDFPTQIFCSDGTADGTLTIYQEDISQRKAGTYSGTLHFEITYTNQTSENTDQPTSNETTIKAGSVTINTSAFPNATVIGLTAYAQDKKEGAYEFTIATANRTTCQEGIAGIASLIAAGEESGTTQYFDFTLVCNYLNESEILSKTISDLDNHVIEIGIPITTTNVSGITAYRYHQKTPALMQKLTTRPTKNYVDNTYYYDNAKGIVYFYSSQFSVFGIHKTYTTTTTTATTEKTILDVDEKTNFTCKIAMKKSTDFTANSMCNPLFYPKADLVVDGDNTKLTLYVIDPIPNYSAEGTPLKNVTFTYNGSTYAATVHSSDKVIKSFASASGFISTAGNYNSSPITVTLPTDAIKEAEDGKLTCSAYVNAVMKSTQNFYVVLTDFEKGETENANTLTQTVATTKTTKPSWNKGNGNYSLPITAIKEKSNDASMMADYMYPLADFTINGDSYQLTLYIQHTVAGIEAGGPKYLKYETTQATKKEHAITFQGISYDSFTLTLANDIPNPMPVSMYINAMSMEVNARLVFGFDNMTTQQTQGNVVTSAPVASNTTKKSTTNSVSSTLSQEKLTSAKSTAEKQSIVELPTDEPVATTATPTTQDTTTDNQSSTPTSYCLVTDAFDYIYVYIGMTALILLLCLATVIFVHRYRITTFK